MSSDQTDQNELAEEAPVNFREILKRQPYVVVERTTSQEDRSKNRPVLHLTGPDRAHRKVTLCGLRFDGGTHIPLESWGKTDRTWCRNCMYLARNSVKNKLKKQVAEYRKAAAQPAVNPIPVTPDSLVLTPAAAPVPKKSSKQKENRPASADQS